MPIDLTKLNAVSAAPAIRYTPKFFDTLLTGNGAGSGLLKQAVNPANNHVSDSERQDFQIMFDKTKPFKFTNTVTNNGTGIGHVDRYFTFDPYYGNAMTHFYNIDQDHLGRFIHVEGKLYMRLRPYRSRVRQVTTNFGGKRQLKTLLTMYMIEFVNTGVFNHVIDYSDTEFYYQDRNTWNMPTLDSLINDCESYDVIYTLDPIKLIDFLEIRNNIHQDLKSSSFKKIRDYLKNFSLFDSLCEISKAFQTQSALILKAIANNYPYQGTYAVSQGMSQYLNIITGLRLPLDQYQEIFNFLQKTFAKDQDILQKMLDENLNLKFNAILNKLNNVKNQLAANNNSASVSKRLSLEQAKAVKTNSPLALIEAGAGTGKSSVILNRIKYLINSGVKPDDILVLSFTNAAADHIKSLYPDIKSTTIASLVNSIYSSNYKDQAIVSSATFYNTLRIAYKGTKSPFMQQVIDAADYLTQKPEEVGVNYLDEGYKLMSNLAKKKPDLIAKICQTLGQTTLDMQIIMAYTCLGRLNIDNEDKAKFVLVDEVQDNSIFDFMFLLKYVYVNRANFFIVGDASQTLYAFRNANPRALNVLEASNVFDVYKLETNFRSRQEILSYANVLLSQTQSNIFAKIQLRANSLRKPTQKDYDNNVRILHAKSSVTSAYSKKAIKEMIEGDAAVKTYIQNCLNRGEKVAFLAYTHELLNAMKTSVTSVLNKKDIADISSRHLRDITLFSGFWAHISDDRIQNLYTANAKDVLHLLKNMIINNNPDSHYDGTDQEAVDFKLSQWDNFVKYNSVEISNNLAEVKAGKKTVKQYVNFLMHIMLDSEIRTNRVRQQTSKSINNTDKKLDAIANNNLLFSTIHSAKGLEFDNVVIFIPAHAQMPEADKRLYYVGLTRAKNSEFVMIADNREYDNSPMVTNYRIARKEFN